MILDSGPSSDSFLDVAGTWNVKVDSSFSLLSIQHSLILSASGDKKALGRPRASLIVIYLGICNYSYSPPFPFR
jgi:hypothetical protein